MGAAAQKLLKNHISRRGFTNIKYLFAFLVYSKGVAINKL
jgi:hypothetical protein